MLSGIPVFRQVFIIMYSVTVHTACRILSFSFSTSSNCVATILFLMYSQIKRCDNWRVRRTEGHPIQSTDLEIFRQENPKKSHI